MTSIRAYGAPADDAVEDRVRGRLNEEGLAVASISVDRSAGIVDVDVVEELDPLSESTARKVIVAAIPTPVDEPVDPDAAFRGRVLELLERIAVALEAPAREDAAP